ncbi:phage portal family protein [Arthrobacter woluwensis]|uniref:phage portal protein n=1 Tax=Arthrobacter woluwensis TaxID=156980 RepID=UPI001643AEA6|nr:phage portal protein [Arthrobacter woluwensis]
MGILQRLRDLFGFSQTSGFPDAVLASPWSTGTGLAPVLAADLGYGTFGTPVTRLEALTCPPIYRGMAALSTLAAQARFTYEDGSELSDEDAWMNAGIGSITPGSRVAALLQDLVFARDTVLWVEREGEKIVQGVPLPRELWGLDWAGNVIINGKTPADQSQFIYIQSLMPMGLCEAAAETVRHFHDIRNTVRERGRSPIPLVELHVTEDFAGTSQELRETRDNFAAARNSPGGAVAITPRGIDLKVHPGSGGDDLLTSARNAVRLDFANFLNLNASLLEGANGASSTYENTLQTKDELITLSLEQWLIPIEQRLSMPDVTRSGKRIVLDTSSLTSGPIVTAKGNTGTATAAPTVTIPPTTPQGELNP